MGETVSCYIPFGPKGMAPSTSLERFMDHAPALNRAGRPGIWPFANGRFAGLPFSRWAFAFRMWLAIHIALGVAFWLQFDGADTAGVVAALLAMQTRGQTFEKGTYLLLGTVVGGAMAIVIVGLFAQARDLYVIAYSAWLAICVFGAGFLDGNRAYGAVVCGYTVSIVGVFQIDHPGNVFSDTVNRCAAISVGILSVLLINDVLRGAEIGPGLIGRVGSGAERARAFADRLLRDGPAPDTDSRVGAALQTISVQHPLLNALPIEAVSGTARAGAVRATLAALAGEVRGARALALAARRRSEPGDPSLHDLVLRRLQGELEAQRQTTETALAAARAGRPVPHAPRMPIYRPAQNAVLNALRAFVASVLVAFGLVRLGWSQTSTTWGFVGILMCFAGNAPDPGGMTKGMIIAIPCAVVLGGITEFLILNGVDQFPLLMIGTAPALIGALLLTSSPKPALSSIGLLTTVFTVVSMSLGNPQSYDPKSYLTTALLLPLAVILDFLLVRVLFPTDDVQRRRWALDGARHDLFASLQGKGRIRREDEARLLDASRIGTVAGLRSTQPADIPTLLQMADLATAARRIRRGLARIKAHPDGPGTLPPDRDAAIRTALAAADASALRQAARSLADGGGDALSSLAADLAWAACLIDTPPHDGASNGVRTSTAPRPEPAT